MMVDIMNGVATRDDMKFLQSIPEDRWFKLERNEAIKPDDISEIVTQVRGKLAEVSMCGAQQIHLFFGGPVMLPAILGAEMANWGNVILWAHNPGTHNYENWGPLKHAWF